MNRPASPSTIALRDKLRALKASKTWDALAAIFDGEVHSNTLRNFLDGNHTPNPGTLRIIAAKINQK